MAQLVQFNKPPSRHHALKKGQILVINQTISQQKQQERAIFSQIFEDFESQKKSLLKRYITNRMSLDERAMLFAQRSTARRFIVELITLGAHWHKAIEDEVEAMITLAQKIAGSVLNKPVIAAVKDAEKNELKAYLANYFNIQFLLPLEANRPLQEIPFHLAHYFARLSFLTVNQHDKGAQVKIIWHGESRTLAIDYGDLPWILNRAIKTIIKFEHQ